MSEYTPTERAEQKYPFWLPTGDYEIDCEDYSEMDAAWQNAEAEMQRQAYIAGAESERAKRPDREQIAHALWAHDGGSLCRAPICRYNDDDADADYECQCTRCWAIALSMAVAVLALEPETREEQGQVEWGVAYRQNDGKLFVDEAVDYDDAVFRVANSSVYDMVVQRRVTAYAPVGAAPAPEAREEAEYFRDGDGDLWKFTGKGEWFHEEEPGEFRQVLSIDAEDQTLTPVGHAELAPAPKAREVTEERVEAAAVAIAGEYDRRGRYLAGTWWSNPRRRDPLRLEARAALEAAREVE